MAFVQFSMAAPFNQVAVNPDEIVSIAAETDAPAAATQLFIDNRLRIVVQEPMGQVARTLGADFVRLEAAATTPHFVHINRTLVTHVVPNPDVANVCFASGRGRKVAIKGTLRAIVAALGASATRPGV